MRKVTIKPKDPNSTLLIPSEGIRATFKQTKSRGIELSDEEWKILAMKFKGDPLQIQRKLRAKF